MRIVIAIAVLFLAGCTTQTPPRGNEPTYSGNGQGQYNQQILEACANAVYEALQTNPGLPGDAMFKQCYTQNGVQTI